MYMFVYKQNIVFEFGFTFMIQQIFRLYKLEANVLLMTNTAHYALFCLLEYS